jgi:hypothetical protein
MNFYKYLENKFLLSESKTNYYFDKNTKKFYPISDNKFYTGIDPSDEKKISKSGVLPKLIDDVEIGLIPSGKNVSIKVLIKQKEPGQNTEKADYILVDGLYHPTFSKNNKFGYIDSKGIFTEINLNEYKVQSKDINNYYTILRKKGSGGGMDSDLQSLEGAAETTEETPAEAPPEETK